MRRLTLASMLCVLLLICATPLTAQRFLGTITGTVTDTSGAVVANADVTITEDATGFTRSAKTDSQGNYSFQQLPLGTYRVEVSQTGFKKSVKQGVELHVADVLKVPIQLQAGGTTEVVNVEAGAIQLNTENAEIAGLVTGQQVRELPLNGRNFTQLTQLMPGVSTNESFDTKNKGLLTGVDISVSGGGVTNNLWLVDGASNNDVGSQRTILVYPSVDSIAEFKVHRNNYGAEFGQAAGAQVNIITKSGENQFHGSVYYFGRNDALNAANFFAARTGEKEKLRRNDYGYTIGGPIKQDKIFFFWSQEWNKEKRGTTRTSFVPTAEDRVGNFNSPLPAGCDRGPDVPVDPLTSAPFPGNQIPTGRISPGGALFLQLFPEPNVPIDPTTCTNWIGNITTPIDWREEQVRGDINITKSTQLMLRYTQDAWTNNAPNANTFWGDDPFPAVDSSWDQPGKQAVAKLTQTIGTSAVNSFQFSYSGNRINITRGGTNPQLNDQINAAIIPMFGFGEKVGGDQVGHPIFWGGGGYPTLWNMGPWNNSQDLYALRDDFSKVMGTHTLKIGGLYGWNSKNEEVQSSSGQNSQFWGSAGLLGTGDSTGSTVADFLLRDMGWGFDELRTSPIGRTRWKDFEVYVADSWKVSRNFTLDLGVRYSILFEPYDDKNIISTFVPGLFDPALGSSPCNGVLFAETNPCPALGFAGGGVAKHRALRANDYNAFAPRLGFAWNLMPKSVLRGGVGQFFQRERVAPYLFATSNPPFNATLSGVRLLDSNTFCDGCSASVGSPTASLETDAKLPNSWQWNLAWEQELFPNSTLEVAYVGNRGIHLTSTSILNQVQAPNRAAYAQAVLNEASEDEQAALRPFPELNNNSNIGIFARTGNSIYHSLQSQFRTRWGRGSQFQASYTWSRLIEDALLNNSDGGLSFETSSDPTNPKIDRGASSIHRPHVFNASLVLLTPELTNTNGFVKNVFGDWEVANIVVLNHGAPVMVRTGNLPGVQGLSGTGFPDNNRPNRVPGVSCHVSGGPREAFINPDAFTVVGMNLGDFGDAGRSPCYGPGNANVDLAFYKNWKVPFFKSRFTSETMGIQFRLEIFNLFNHANFKGPFDNGAPDFNTTIDPNLDPTTDIVNGTIVNNSGFTNSGRFGLSTTARDPRQIQYALKFIF